MARCPGLGTGTSGVGGRSRFAFYELRLEFGWGVAVNG